MLYTFSVTLFIQFPIAKWGVSNLDILRACLCGRFSIEIVRIVWILFLVAVKYTIGVVIFHEEKHKNRPKDFWEKLFLTGRVGNFF